MSQYDWNNCPTEVKQQIGRLCQGFRLQLAGNLIGIYLHGSMANGCFNPLRSDLDLLVVTHETIAVETKRGLAWLLLDVSLRPCPVEISFLRRSDLHPWQYPTAFDFHYSEDWREKFERELSRDDWKQWNAVHRLDYDLAAHITVLNHGGVCLYGQPIPDVFPPVPQQDFLHSILNDVLSADSGLNAVLQNPVYVILNSCRTLAFLRTERVLSKDEGGEWALENLPAKFHQIITAVLAEYRNHQKQSDLNKEHVVKLATYLGDELMRAAQSKGSY